MPVTVRCQHCGQRYSVREELLGKQIKCKACSQVMAIVAQAAAPRAAAAKPAAAAARPPAAQPAAGAAKLATAAPAKPRAPAADPLFGPPGSFLDLLNDATLPAPGAAPLDSGVTLKSTKPAHAAKPAAKKKKKKGSGGASVQTRTTLRMLGGACIILGGLGVIGLAIVKFTSDDESGLHIGRGIRLTILGFSIIGGGLKLIIG